ncbi:XkdX family protein [Paenibacillus sp. HJL G12]|uniref:XkdX family protein n=1 Tax=Paenibacillus dendrobii TaxID=2691084 RepID=A0A7X3IJG4_9BACL|nr:XkdX family protein [Paenibacillus dendrobii]MWV44576.1 XkdX family protein [Paenibacillus dendrobii]
MFENDFERLKYYFEKKWANDLQLKQYVDFKVITQEEYKLITDREYQG